MTRHWSRDDARGAAVIRQQSLLGLGSLIWPAGRSFLLTAKRRGTARRLFAAACSLDLGGLDRLVDVAVEVARASFPPGDFCNAYLTFIFSEQPTGSPARLRQLIRDDREVSGLPGRQRRRRPGFLQAFLPRALRQWRCGLTLLRPAWCNRRELCCHETRWALTNRAPGVPKRHNTTPSIGVAQDQNTRNRRASSDLPGRGSRQRRSAGP